MDGAIPGLTYGGVVVSAVFLEILKPSFGSMIAVLVWVRYGPDDVKCDGGPASCRDRQIRDDWECVSLSTIVDFKLQRDA